MAKFSVCLVKKSAHRKMASKAPGVKAVGSAFTFVDNEDDSVSVQGSDAGGNPVDISAVASIAVVSSDLTVLTVDPPVGTTFKMHGLKPGHSDVAVTATWNDPTAGIGPFAATLPCDVTAGGVSGLVITPGVPTPRP